MADSDRGSDGTLSGPEPFGGAAETHTAVVYFAGDRAYKLKKPVRTGFLDFSTASAREAACRRETELNRRFAPDVYLGVAEVDGPGGKPADHLVVMRRMPAARRLSALVEAGAPVGPAVREIAKLVAAQHAAAERSAQISRQGGAGALLRRWRDNIAEIRPLLGGYIAEGDVDDVARLSERFVAGRVSLLDDRIRAGRIVDGHGDLLAGDIFCLDDGPRILDCIEFSDELRWLDGLDDASCLAMDLERLGAGELASQFTAWYLEFSADPAPGSLRHHYVAYRAFMRAKVGCLRAAQGDDHAGTDAAGLTELALRHLRAGAVRLVLVGGLPGTGKSSLAGALADALGWTVLSSDRTRKELAGLAAGQHAPAAYQSGIYAATWTERAYAEMITRAERLLSMGESVIIDATWNSVARRAAAAAAAARLATDLVQIRCTAPKETAWRRIAARTGTDSDADIGIAAAMARDWQPWPEAVTIEAGPDPARLLGQALAATGN